MKNSYRDTAQILCYHDIKQILCYYGNIMKMLQPISLKLQCKKTTSKKEEVVRLHPDPLRDFHSSISEFRA